MNNQTSLGHVQRNQSAAGAAEIRMLPLGLGTVLLGASVALFDNGAIVAIALAAAFVTVIFAIASNAIRDWIFVALVFLPLLLGMAVKTSGVNLFGYWQIPLALLALLGLPAFRKAVAADGMLQLYLAVFTAFLFWALLSSVSGRTRMLAGAYQFLSDVKPLFVLLLGFAVLWTPRIDRTLHLVTRWLWLPALALVAFEWAAPGTYFGIFSGGGALARGSTDPTGLLPSRAVGLFEHPSFLASTAAFFAIVSAARVAHGRAGKRWPYVLLTGVYLLLIICSVQRQEIAACGAAILMLFLLAKRAQFFSRLFVALLVGIGVAAIFWLLYADNIIRESASWGVGNSRMVEHPRAQIFAGAWRLANEYFPFGAGLGTYGGAGAAKFDESLYRDLGFGRYWWFGKEDYLMDTYWPNSLGETGFVGAALLLSSFVLLFGYAVRRSFSSAAKSLGALYWSAAAGGMVYMLALSATSPAFQEPRLFVLPGLLFGIAYGASTHAEIRQ